MPRNQKKVSANGVWVLIMVFLNVIVLKQGLVANGEWYKLIFLTVPLSLVAILQNRRPPAAQRLLQR